MSTDIVHFGPQDKKSNTGGSHKIVQVKALQLYLAISLPLVVVTLFAWYAFYWWEVHKEKRSERRKKKPISIEAQKQRPTEWSPVSL